MRKFTVHRGTAVPLRRRHVDTDQIIPGEFCKRIGRTGYADALFAEWRDDPGYLLARPEYARGSVLVAGEGFGIGSSREHAVWALMDHGFRAVLAPSFSDIFQGNAIGNGLLPVRITEEETERLWEIAERAPETVFTVDLEECAVTAGDARVDFTLDAHSRFRLLNGLDAIGATLRHETDISAYENRRSRWLPRTA
ncbi:3-isopropylmalate dehydratase small subunit [Streptomyces sp. HNM0574]|uniref:3-isopropylmalate dehydratase small subunit n=1 Tax=Streptomyces sp. HNM0574 TaxID=2714954 RepID=UPI00146A0F7A|nr:3-isopropylmalate dehydratase small subunit [Streptomyces sp. HNM0574]NLU71031.1 3-isopropylmalate dehydratase small subunit [Streptomyces sp. HNM0574]